MPESTFETRKPNNDQFTIISYAAFRREMKISRVFTVENEGEILPNYNSYRRVLRHATNNIIFADIRDRALNYRHAKGFRYCKTDSGSFGIMIPEVNRPVILFIPQ